MIVTLKHFILIWYMKYFKSVLPDMSLSLNDLRVKTRKYLRVRSVNDIYLFNYLRKLILLSPPAQIQIHIQIQTQRQNTCQDAFICMKPTWIQRSRLTTWHICFVWTRLLKDFSKSCSSLKEVKCQIFVPSVNSFIGTYCYYIVKSCLQQILGQVLKGQSLSLPMILVAILYIIWTVYDLSVNFPYSKWTVVCCMYYFHAFWSVKPLNPADFHHGLE